MLIVTRRVGERLLIGDHIEVTITSAARGCAGVGIAAPREVVVLRAELPEAAAAAAPSRAEEGTC